MHTDLGFTYTKHISGETFLLVPPSTQYACLPKIRWWHPQDCKVLTGHCTCETPKANHEQPRTGPDQLDDEDRGAAA